MATVTLQETCGDAAAIVSPSREQAALATAEECSRRVEQSPKVLPDESVSPTGYCSLGLPLGDAATLGMDLRPVDACVGQLRAQVDAGQMPGFLSCVIRRGQLLHLESYGFADLRSATPLRPDALFRLYSQTKPVLVVGLLLLRERGLVSLEDPIDKYIPAFAGAIEKKKNKPITKSVTVWDLLAHTSGIGFGPGFGYEAENEYESLYVDLVRSVDSREVTTLADWCDRLAKLPLQFQPGKDWGYGYSSDVLGRVVEVVSGRPLDEFLRVEVIEPLGMVDTGFLVPSDKSSRLTALYKREPWDGGGKNVLFITADPGGSGLTDPEGCTGVEASQAHASNSSKSVSVFLDGTASNLVQGGGCVCSVAGGLVSTLRDYARFSLMLLNDGELDGVRLLSAESVHLLARDWLNDFTPVRRRKPLWVWGTPGIGFSPLGQIGVAHPQATGRRGPGAQLQTVHWGGAGGSSYMLSWPHQLLVLTYTGCVYDTDTQKAMWRSSFAALRNKRVLKAKPTAALKPTRGMKRPASKSKGEEPHTARRRGSGRRVALKRPAAR